MTTSYLVPMKVEGLETDGPMGKAPTLTIGGVIAGVSLLYGIASQLFGYTLPAEASGFLDGNGTLAAGAVVGVISLAQAIVTYHRVFSPASVAERYVKRPSLSGRPGA